MWQGKRNWLKFGAADEKGEVLEESWAAKGPCLAVEFGSFLGYSAVKMWRSLGKASKALRHLRSLKASESEDTQLLSETWQVITFEMDPEVASLVPGQRDRFSLHPPRL